MLYNDRAVLENHHASASLRLMKDEDYNIISSLKPAEYRHVVFADRVIAKFHYTDPTGPARTLSATRTAPHGLFLRRNSVGSVRVADKVRAGPVGSV